MSDLIDRQLAIDAIEEYADRLQMLNWKENPNVPYKVYTLNWCVNTIRDLASAQPARKTGQWIRSDNPVTVWYRCSICNCLSWYGIYNYCPNCGAKMDEVSKDE